MIPTLAGRWHTRILLLGTVGLVITLGFGLLFDDMLTPLALLGYVVVIGCGWDILYNYLQTLRWDRDWPPIFFVAAGILEGGLLWLLVKLVTLPGISAALTINQFVAHYGTVWLVTFLLLLGPLKVFLLRWRFRGGQLF